jgi:hypothetical protein
MCESDSPFRGRNPVWRGLVTTASLEFADRFVSNAIALPGTRRGDREAVGGDAGRVRKNGVWKGRWPIWGFFLQGRY